MHWKLATQQSIILLLFLIPTLLAAQWQTIEKILGRKGMRQGNVLTMTFFRTDLHVKVAAIDLEPAMITSRVSFLPEEDRIIVMGEMIVLESELLQVIKKLTTHDFEISSVDKFLTGEEPDIISIHYSARGQSDVLARAIRDILSTNTTRPTAPSKESHAGFSSLEQALGYKGHSIGNVYQVFVPRADRIKEGWTDIPPVMGVASTLNFQMEGSKVIAIGSFVLTAEEVQPVVRLLTERGITISAVHTICSLSRHGYFSSTSGLPAIHPRSPLL